MRPDSIVRFDQLYLGALALGFADMVFVVFTTPGRRASDGFAVMFEGLSLGLSAIGVAISLLLWFFISRRGSNVAKWVLVVLAVINTLGTLPLLSQAPLLMQAVPAWQIGVTLVTTGMNLAALWFLFQPDAKAWFADARYRY